MKEKPTISLSNLISYINPENKEISQFSLQKKFPIAIKESKKKVQHTFTIGDIEITFPFKPYKIQIDYMTKVIMSLNEGKSNISALESPTGTGKTLCLLCACLAWYNKRKKEKKFNGKILYASRTHSQLSNVIKELKKTIYVPQTSILSSRINSCVNDELKSNEKDLLNIKCKIYKVDCPYFKRTDSMIKDKYNLLDIEEIVKYGKKNFFCPYYFSRDKSKKISDIIFLPYNYIFNKEIRNSLEIPITNSILI